MSCADAGRSIDSTKIWRSGNVGDDSNEPRFERTVELTSGVRMAAGRSDEKRALLGHFGPNIIIIFLHGLGRLTCSGIDALPSFPGASAISSSLVEGVFRESGVVHSFKMVDPVLYW